MAHDHRTTLRAQRARAIKSELANRQPAGVRHVRATTISRQSRGLGHQKMFSCPVANHYLRETDIHHNRDEFVSFGRVNDVFVPRVGSKSTQKSQSLVFVA